MSNKIGTVSYPPIAIIGRGCRLPCGITDADGLWDFLLNGRDAVKQQPSGRWNLSEVYDPDNSDTGKTYCKVGAFLDNPDRFDAGFFGISAAEAKNMDPQQRLLLEVTWEAIEDAGRMVSSLKESRTGIYIGMLGMDYAVLQSRETGVASINPYYATGVEFSFGAGRLAYVLGTQGPAMTLCTACSSSLVAVHQACRALIAHEADLALAGGVNLMLAPDLTIFMSQVKAISPTGHCHVFDKKADGIVRGEGCGIVVLRRLEDAIKDGDRILAVIPGSAINHDGPSAGLTVPNSTAQSSVIKEALTLSGYDAAALGYIEAHGTGTPLGDPIEADALKRVFSVHKPVNGRQRPYIGSLKANFGHMDAAAGIAGLLKVIEIVRHGALPPQIHLEDRNPVIDWANSPFQINTNVTDFPEVNIGHGKSKRLAGVNAFGLSGTNAHILVAAYDHKTHISPEETPGPFILPLSAHAPAALKAMADKMSTFLCKNSDLNLPGILYTAGVCRDHHRYRMAAIGKDRKALAEHIHLLSNEIETNATNMDKRRASKPIMDGLVYVFTGQGGQWPGMFVDLMKTDHVCSEIIAKCDTLIEKLSGWKVSEELLKPKETSRLNLTEIVQPVIFAIQVALYERFRSWGIKPAAVIGHSMGEVAAAYAAGVFDLQTAIYVIWHRANSMKNAKDGGRMLAVGLSENELAKWIRGINGVEIASINSPVSCVIAGPEQALKDLHLLFEEKKLFSVMLPGKYAFHSKQMEPFQPIFAKALTNIPSALPNLKWYSTTIASDIQTGVDAKYWVRNIRAPVMFSSAIHDALVQGHRCFLEIGPHTVLQTPIRQSAAQMDIEIQVASALIRERPGEKCLIDALKSLYEWGLDPDWAKIEPDGQIVSLPSYPWVHNTHYWFEKNKPAVTDNHSLNITRQFGSHAVTAELRLTGPDGETLTKFIPVDSQVYNEQKPQINITKSCLGKQPEYAGILAEIIADIHDLLGKAEGSTIEAGRGFFDLGLESISLTELRRRLQSRYNIKLPMTVAFDNPTAERLAEAVLNETGATNRISPKTAEPKILPAQTDASDGNKEKTIAIIGMGCRFPGASDPQEFWQLLSKGKSAFGPMPNERWPDQTTMESGLKDVLPSGGYFLNNPYGFDANFFHISPKEARYLDPQQRMFLMVAWEALENAGQNPAWLNERDIGVYVGVNSHDYEHLIAANPSDIDAYFGTGTSVSGISGRLSHYLGLQGPSLSVDTACSSALSALHLACQAIQAGECSMAIVGGVNIITSPTIFRSMGDAGALAKDGVCKTFSALADGYGRGEGCGVVILKPLEAARRDLDHIIAVIKSSAINHDGPSAGLTVPSGHAQQQLIKTALDKAGLSTSDIGYIETHGTGTPLGDPIELYALNEVFKTGHTPDNPLLVGSVKTNIGHLEAASGMASLLKLCLAIEYGEIPSSLHFEQPSTAVNWKEIAIKVVTAPTFWKQPNEKRVAGLNGFGFTGTNVHVVIGGAGSDQYSNINCAIKEHNILPFVVSAQCRSSLQALVARLIDWLSGLHTGISFNDICATAALRRKAMHERLAFASRNVDDLVRQLKFWLEHDSSLPAAFSTEEVSEPVNDLIRQFYAGKDVDWSILWPHPQPNIPFPGYAWELESHRLKNDIISAKTATDLAIVHSATSFQQLSENKWILRLSSPAGENYDKLSHIAAVIDVLGNISREIYGTNAIMFENVEVKTQFSPTDLTLVLSIEPVNKKTQRHRFTVHVKGQIKLTGILSSGYNFQNSVSDKYVSRGARSDMTIITERLTEILTGRNAKIVGRQADQAAQCFDIEFATDDKNKILSDVDLIALSLELMGRVTGETQGNISGLDQLRLLPDIPAKVKIEISKETLSVKDMEDNILFFMAGLRRNQIAEYKSHSAAAYELVWPKLKTVKANTVKLPGYWVIIAPKSLCRDKIIRYFANAGLQIRIYQSGIDFQIALGADGILNPTQRDHLKSLLQEEMVKADCLGLIHAAAAETVECIDAVTELSMLTAFARVLKDVNFTPKPVWFATAGGHGDANPARAAFTAMSRCLGLEHPLWWGGTVDLDMSDIRSLQTFAFLLTKYIKEDYLAIRGPNVFYAKLQKIDTEFSNEGTQYSGPDFSDGQVIIYNPPAPMIAPLVDWLLACDTSHITVLLPTGSKPIAKPEGTEISFECVTWPNDKPISNRLAELRNHHGRICAVIDASVDWVQSPLHDITPEKLEIAVVAEPQAFENLIEALQDEPPDICIRFSTAAAMWGAPNMALSAAKGGAVAANSRQHRRACQKDVCIDWTQWCVSITEDQGTQQILNMSGITALDGPAINAALSAAYIKDYERIAFGQIDWSVLRPLYQQQLAWPMLDSIEDSAMPKSDISNNLKNEITRLPQDLRNARTIREVCKIVADCFGYENTDNIDPRRGFFDMGMTSMMSLDLRNRFNKVFGLNLPATIAFEYSSAKEMTNMILRDYINPEAEETGTYPLSPHEKTALAAQPDFAIKTQRHNAAGIDGDLVNSLEYEIAEIEDHLKENGANT